MPILSNNCTLSLVNQADGDLVCFGVSVHRTSLLRFYLPAILSQTEPTAFFFFFFFFFIVVFNRNDRRFKPHVLLC